MYRNSGSGDPDRSPTVKVSVLMFVYNHAPYLKQAIEGILPQRTDFRAFASKYYHIRLRNDFVLFGTGVMAHLRFFMNRKAEDKEQLKLVTSAHMNAAVSELILISYAPYALFTLLRRQLQKIRWS